MMCNCCHLLRNSCVDIALSPLRQYLTQSSQWPFEDVILQLHLRLQQLLESQSHDAMIPNSGSKALMFNHLAFSPLELPLTFAVIPLKNRLLWIKVKCPCNHSIRTLFIMGNTSHKINLPYVPGA